MGLVQAFVNYQMTGSTTVCSCVHPIPEPKPRPSRDYPRPSREEIRAEILAGRDPFRVSE